MQPRQVFRIMRADRRNLMISFATGTVVDGVILYLAIALVILTLWLAASSADDRSKRRVADPPGSTPDNPRLP
jgi:hypothetical protein